MTKEEIWNNNIHGWKLVMTDKGYANALTAMDEYAKQQAIAFMKFCLKNGIISSDMDDDVYFDGNYWHDPSYEESATRIYNQLIEQQNKQV